MAQGTDNGLAHFLTVRHFKQGALKYCFRIIQTNYKLDLLEEFLDALKGDTILLVVDVVTRQVGEDAGRD